MSHHGHHGHHDHGTGDAQGQLSDRQKLEKMVAHWLHHNEEHARSYGEWAKRAQALGFEAVARILEEVAESTRAQNESFQKIATLLSVEGRESGSAC